MSLPDAEGYGEAFDQVFARVAEERRTPFMMLVWAYLTGRQLEAWLHDALAPDGLGTSDYGVLASLWLHGAPHRLSAGELSGRLVQTSGGTTKTLQRLLAQGYVTRITDPEDGRRSLVELTPAGLTMAEEVLDRVVARFDQDLGDLAETQRAEVLTGLQSLSGQLAERLNQS